MLDAKGSGSDMRREEQMMLVFKKRAHQD